MLLQVFLANQERNPQPSVVPPQDVTVIVKISNCCSVSSSYTGCPLKSPSNQKPNTLLPAHIPLTKSPMHLFPLLQTVWCLSREGLTLLGHFLCDFLYEAEKKHWALRTSLFLSLRCKEGGLVFEEA